MEQQIFDFAPPECKVDTRIRAKLERAVRAIGSGAVFTIIDENLRSSVIVRARSIAVRTSAVPLMLLVGDYLGKGQRVRRALDDWAKRETEMVAKRNTAKIGTNTTVDWRPDEAVSEDFYAY